MTNKCENVKRKLYFNYILKYLHKLYCIVVRIHCLVVINGKDFLICFNKLN